jgi:hypothetical protein
MVARFYPPQPAADVPVCFDSILFESINPKAFKLLFLQFV